MSRTMPGRLAAASALSALLLGVAACGSADDGSSGSADPSPASQPSEVTDPGDDLLAAEPRSSVFEGTDAELGWRLPASYEAEDPAGRQASSSDGEVVYSLTVGANPGEDRESAAESYVADEDVSSEVDETTVGDTEVSVVTADTGDLRSQAWFFTPEGTDAAYAVLFFTSVALEEVPEERFEEVRQLLGSLEVDGQPL